MSGNLQVYIQSLKILLKSTVYMLPLVNLCIFLPGIITSCYCYHAHHTSLRVCLEPVMDGGLQGYASCAEWEQSGMISPGERSGFFFFFFCTYTSQSICVHSHSKVPRQPTSFGILKRQKVSSFFFFSGLTQTLNFLEWQFRQFPSQHETGCAHQLWVGDGSQWLPPS